MIRTVVAREIAGRAPGYRVLEVGCGTGYVLKMLHHECQGGVVVGMDLFREGLRLAGRRSPAHLVQARVEAPPFGDPFEVVGMFDTLEHVPDDAGVLRHLRRLTAPGGALVITVPAYAALWSEFDEEAQHCRRYEPAMLETRLAGAGFAVEYLTPFMSMLYPLARAGRWTADRLRRRRRASGQPAESAVSEQLRVRPLINPLLFALLRQDARFVARRRRLPFGTSLLAVARPA